MFRPFQPFVTIITAPAGVKRHYASLGPGVECLLWVVTKARLLKSFRGLVTIFGNGITMSGQTAD